MKSREKNNGMYLIVLVFCLCAVCMLWGGYHYIASVRNGLEEQAVANVLAVTQQQQQAFDNFILNDRERIHSFSMNFASCRSDDLAGIADGLAAFSEVEAVYTVMNLETGAYYINKDAGGFQMNREQLESYRELSGSGVRHVYIGLYSENESFGYYECFTFADGVPGLFLKGYDSGKVSGDFSLSFYNDQGFAYIVDRQGEILLRSVAENGVYQGNNIFDQIDIGRDNEGSGSLAAALESQETGAAFLDNSTGGYVYTYVPLESVEGWYLISVVPKDAIINEADHIIDYSQLILVIFLAALFVFCIAALLTERSQRIIRKQDREIGYQEELFNIFSSYLSKNTGDIYLMFDKADGTIDYVSPNFERILGIEPPKNIYDMKFKTVSAGGSLKERVDAKVRDLHPGDSLEPVETEWEIPGKGGHKWFRETIYCVNVQKREKLVVYISDRTGDKEVQHTLSSALEMAQIANRAKSTFLSSVSHDIRTPMNAIMGLVTLLVDEADDPSAVREYAHRIDAASQHLLGLINDVLDMNKIESGNVVLNISELDLAELIDEINTIIRPQTKAKRQDFDIFTSSFTCEHLLGDKSRISQILINVLSNAVKYTQEGGRIELSVRELPRVVDKFNRIEFTIKDNGQGMSEEYQKIIFNPFTREQETGKNKVQGTGLGMSITKNLVELMGGTIRLKSSPGKGSTFIIELELRTQEKEADQEFWRRNGVKRMLVADDDPDICANVQKAMSQTGVVVHFITNGEKVIETAKAAREAGEPYDLFLLDWKMPDIDGLEMARLIRENYSRKVPILLFTAYDWVDIEAEAESVGVDHFLPKPFFMTNFMNVIERVMNKTAKGKQKGVSIVKDKRVLVVEDIEVNRLVLVKILTARGASCEIAVNGEEAVNIFGKSPPGAYDLILMDIQMPVMDGYEATRQIRACAHPDAQKVAIIAMTANAFADDVKNALEAGMDAHVAKPIVLDRLENAIEKVLKEKK